MKIFFLEPDRDFAQNITDKLNSTRLQVDMKIVQDEAVLFLEEAHLHEYALFILNLKNPIDKRVLNLIRNRTNETPILLILEKDVKLEWVKILYYLSYDDIIIKDFYPEEILFHIYKLCDVWNDDVFTISKGVYFDFKHSHIVHNEEKIHLGKKEALMLKFLFVKSPHFVSCDELIYYVYEDEIVSTERIRSLMRQTRGKLPVDLIETKRGLGYRIAKLESK